MATVELIAYHRADRPNMRIVPAGRWREWMSATTLRYANRCLPLLMANESGWWLLNERRFTATWRGGDHARDVTVEYDDGVAPRGRAVSLFGYGVLTFEIPWLFRTPPGWNLLARGPANMPRDGIAPLEGLVETDWSVATFTMNWRFTRPGTVVFVEGEPVCMIVPQRRGELEEVVTTIRSVDEEPDTAAGWEAFRRSRHEISVQKFLAEHVGGSEDARNGWESHYFRGRRPDSTPASQHQTKVRLQEFD
jgi:Family of unknown function (DUF6065)